MMMEEVEAGPEHCGCAIAGGAWRAGVGLQGSRVDIEVERAVSAVLRVTQQRLVSDNGLGARKPRIRQSCLQPIHPLHSVLPPSVPDSPQVCHRLWLVCVGRGGRPWGGGVDEDCILHTSVMWIQIAEGKKAGGSMQTCATL